MTSLLKRGLSALSLSGSSTPADPTVKLSALDVPLTLEDCHVCPHPCAEGEDAPDFEDYGKGFDVDMESEMLGSLKPYARQVVISTGKADWPREVTAESSTLAGLLSKAADALAPSTKGASPQVDGVFSTRENGGAKLTILNGSNLTGSHEREREAVLVFPDYLLVEDVPVSLAGAEELYKTYLDPRVVVPSPSAAPSIPLRAVPLPYFATILLCSHKRRDKRCHIAAPILERELTRCIEASGWEVDTRGDHIADEHPALSALTSTSSPSDPSSELRTRLQAAAAGAGGSRTVGIFKISHIGGHRYAGNVIINFPSGASVWYGRLTAREIPAIVEYTLKRGLVIPQLLRGGANIAGKTVGDVRAFDEQEKVGVEVEGAKKEKQ